MWNKLKSLAVKLKEKAIWIKNKAVNNYKILKWWRGLLVGVIALAITFAPTIYFGLAAIVQNEPNYWIQASAWATFIIAPAGGTGTLLFFGSYLGVSSIWVKLLKLREELIHG